MDYNDVLMHHYASSDFLCHHGILGQKWGIRRFQNKDGTLTAAGKKRYGTPEVYEAAQKATSLNNANNYIGKHLITRDGIRKNVTQVLIDRKDEDDHTEDCKILNKLVDKAGLLKHRNTWEFSSFEAAYADAYYDTARQLATTTHIKDKKRKQEVESKILDGYLEATDKYTPLGPDSSYYNHVGYVGLSGNLLRKVGYINDNFQYEPKTQELANLHKTLESAKSEMRGLRDTNSKERVLEVRKHYNDAYDAFSSGALKAIGYEDSDENRKKMRNILIDNDY